MCQKAVCQPLNKTKEEEEAKQSLFGELLHLEEAMLAVWTFFHWVIAYMCLTVYKS